MNFPEGECVREKQNENETASDSERERGSRKDWEKRAQT